MEAIEYIDTTLYELKKELNNINSEDDLLNWLKWATEHNYYTGNVWDTLYNSNKELEKHILSYYKNNKEYLAYLTFKCDQSDIFLFQSCENLLNIESEFKNNEKINYCLNNYVELLTLEQFNNIYYYDYNAAIDFLDEVYLINPDAPYYWGIDHKLLLQEITMESNIIPLHENIIFEKDIEFIQDLNVL